MSVEAEQLEDWIGSEVVDPEGEKLGKVAEVYYRGPDAVIVEIRSGMIGRKHTLAALAGATVSMKHLRLNVPDTVATDDGVTAETLEELAAHDPRLAGVTPEQLESGTERKARIDAAHEADRYATTLESEAGHRQEEAKIATKIAREAAENAAAAQQASAEAAEKAAQARARATELAQAL